MEKMYFARKNYYGNNFTIDSDGWTVIAFGSLKERNFFLEHQKEDSQNAQSYWEKCPVKDAEEIMGIKRGGFCFSPIRLDIEIWEKKARELHKKDVPCFFIDWC